jgi:hypothetical protein
MFEEMNLGSIQNMEGIMSREIYATRGGMVFKKERESKITLTHTHTHTHTQTHRCFNHFLFLWSALEFTPKPIAAVVI